jgi:exosortase O
MPNRIFGDIWQDHQAPDVKNTSLVRTLRAVINLALLVMWVRLFWPVFQYLGVQFTRDEFRTNQILLLLIAGLLIYQGRRARFRLRLDAAPHLFLPGLALALCASLAYLLSEKYLDINTLSAFLFGLATYGLLGLWMTPARWRQGIPAMLLVVGILPFGEHLETFAGYPLRIFTAGLVRDGLNTLGFHSVGVDTILVFESGISQIDIPCSGVKSLWTGMLFLLAVTWIENRPLSLRWALVALCVGVLLVAANLARVAVLALTGPALGWTWLAEIIHLPMGVLGFGAVCGAAFLMVRGLPVGADRASEPGQSTLEKRALACPAWLGPSLLVCLVGMALAYSPRFDTQAVAAAGSPVWRFPEKLALQAAPLSPQEIGWIQQAGADVADRFNFNWPGEDGQLVNGSLMLLTSRTWRGQHRPERCFEAFGLTLHESFTALPTPDFPIRVLSLSNGESEQRITAVYWLQSANQTTDDFSKRIWSDLKAPQETWVLVTVLFDQPRDPQAAELAGFWAVLHDSVAASLKVGGGR